MIFSIIVPLYNKEKFIKNLLEKLEKNIFKDFEILIIDDKSTDNSLRLVEEYQRHSLLNINLICNLKNKGVSYCRNIGINESKGKYLIFLDADDYFKENTMNELNKIIHDQDLVILKRYYKRKKKSYPNYKILFGNLIRKDKKLYKIKNIWKSLEKKVFLGGSASFVVKKEIIGKTRFEEKENIFEDYDFAFKLIKKCNNIYYFNNKLVYINDLGESLSRRKKKLNEIHIPKFFFNHSENKKISNKLMDIFLFSSYRSIEKKEKNLFIMIYKDELKKINFNKYNIYLKILIYFEKLKNILIKFKKIDLK